MDEWSIKKPWFKTAGGIAVVSLFSLILAIILIFVGFFVYYSWQIKYGNIDNLEKKFLEEKKDNLDSKDNEQKIDLGTPVENWSKLIKKNNPVRGSAEAIVTIVEFVDFECPKCREAYLVLEKVIAKYEPVLKIVFKNLPFEKTHPNSVVAANAASCAKEQGKFWEYYNELFLVQDLTAEGLVAGAENVGLDLVKFSDCMGVAKYQKEINLDLMDAANLNLRGTPSYLVNGYKIEGSLPESVWDKIITQLLQK